MSDNNKPPSSFSISEVQDPFALRLAQDFLPMVPRQEPTEPVKRIDFDSCPTCPYADSGHRLELDKKGKETLVLGTVEKGDVQCLLLREKYKVRKVKGKIIVPSKKHWKCIKTTVDKKGLHGWENPEIFRKCEIARPQRRIVIRLNTNGDRPNHGNMDYPNLHFGARGEYHGAKELKKKREEKERKRKRRERRERVRRERM